MLWLALLLIAALALSLFVGRYPAPPFLAPDRLATDELAQRLVWNLRLPRVLAAILLGMALAAAGTVLQMILGNPLVEPGFLGVSQGAAFGAALSIIFLGNAAWLVQGAAAAFAFVGLGLSYFLAHRLRYGGWVLRLVLAGIAVSALFSAGVGMLKYVADPLRQLPEITFWLLGGLWSITWAQLRAILPVTLIALFVMYRMRWRLNLLALDDATAFSLGVAPNLERALVLTAAVAATAAVISVSGMVGWIGLIMPHLARRLYGSDARRALPAALLLGGLFCLLCDDVARTLLAGEIPLGILTSLLGATFFMALMMKQNIRMSR
ncbi:MAG: ABC transporter permease [Chloroflexi bacterium HGW-Chloroflexi-1]|nr:MAG: ABC transporter permease [Chloroflexi bacterium HGW-Chloroflexi-1]